MEPQEKKTLKKKSKNIASFTSIGKKGITENTITQINTYLKANHLCKVKVLRTYLDETGKSKQEVAKELSEKTNSELIDLIGLTITLWKR
jgi:RNA-binding protein